jgi:hypothetical protein
VEDTSIISLWRLRQEQVRTCPAYLSSEELQKLFRFFNSRFFKRDAALPKDSYRIKTSSLSMREGNKPILTWPLPPQQSPAHLLYRLQSLTCLNSIPILLLGFQKW